MTNRSKIIALICLFLLLAVGGFYLWNKDVNQLPQRDITATTTPPGAATSTEDEDGGADQPVACTADAMLCPDGSYVGRTGPKCQFVCPPIVSSGVFGRVFVGPICPVERIPPDPNCAERPLQTDLALTTYDGSRTVKLFSSDADGQFRISVAPGSYVIRPAPGAPSLPACSETEVLVVRVNSYTESTVHCDSGIR